MYSKILVAIDDGPSAVAVLGVAAAAKGVPRIAHVMNPFAHTSGFESYQAYAGYILPNVRKRCTALLSDACRRASAAGVGSDMQLCETDAQHPGAEVLQDVLAWHPDITVTGTHCRRGGDRLVMGSVAEWIIRRATVRAVRRSVIDLYQRSLRDDDRLSDVRPAGSTVAASPTLMPVNMPESRHAYGPVKNARGRDMKRNAGPLDPMVHATPGRTPIRCVRVDEIGRRVHLAMVRMLTEEADHLRSFHVPCDRRDGSRTARRAPPMNAAAEIVCLAAGIALSLAFWATALELFVWLVTRD